ncbi:prephenate dehydrogenase [Rivularia sp. PCC 7116]|uniref:prephenate/arogenate dehydrogenase n=1 Tax=Rivularia sp. PCC 7116 TaxID=373994 RepID=UPI00029ECCF2|nr:prephenate/arogenate dehydrogenase [Rivularia sp. PCC 7116]AFY55266.1 prephenate dehydrogenase [Rivularia sp. PCC 7116]
MIIGIVGLGLIGGSLGLDLKKQGHHVLGVSRRDSTIQRAISLGVVSQASVNMSLLSEAEVVFICTPLGFIIPTLEQLIAYLPSSCVITDVGSVKTPIVKGISPVWENFVGGHPMAGSNDSGIEAARSNLFSDKPYVLTPINTTPAKAITVIENLISQLGVNIHYCSPEEHDKAVSLISHLPVMASASLIAACDKETDSQVHQLAQKFASSGFRDTSRVGGGNPELGVMMAKYNREALLMSLQNYRSNLDELVQLIEREDWTTLEQILHSTQQARSKYIKE